MKKYYFVKLSEKNRANSWREYNIIIKARNPIEASMEAVGKARLEHGNPEEEWSLLDIKKL